MSSKKSKYKKYDVTTLSSAVKNIKECGMSMYQASKQFNIPRQTLRNKLKFENLPQKQSNKESTVLTSEEENSIVNWIKECAYMGVPRTKDDIIVAAGEISQHHEPPLKKFSNNIPSRMWMKLFQLRHPDISLRSTSNLSKSSAAVSKDDLINYYSKIHSWFIKNDMEDVLKTPGSIFNCDETAFEMNPKLKKAFGPTGIENLYTIDSGKPKECVTATYCICADGTYLKTQLIFKESYSRLPEVAYESGAIKGNFLFSTSPNGWQTKDTFRELIKKLKQEMILKGTQFPAVMLFDNYPAHIDLELFQWCRKEGIIIVSLYPNSTHIIQPLDVGIYSIMKVAWKKAMLEWSRKNPFNDISGVDLVNLLKKINDDVLIPSNIIPAFRATGWFPFDVNNVHLNRCLGVKRSFNNNIITEAQSSPKVIILENAQIVEPDVIDFNENLTNSEELYINDSSEDSFIENFIINVRQDCNNIIQTIERLHPALLLNVQMIQQQLNFMNSFVETSLASPVNSEILKTQEINNLNDILKVPVPPQKPKMNRPMTLRNIGVLTDGEYIKKCEDIKSEKDELQKQKTKRAEMRKERKEVAEKLKNIKKENIENQIPNEKRGRGRPKKIKPI